MGSGVVHLQVLILAIALVQLLHANPTAPTSLANTIKKSGIKPESETFQDDSAPRQARQTGVIFRPIFATRERDNEREENRRRFEEGETAHQQNQAHSRRTRQTGVIFRPLFASRERDNEREENGRRLQEGQMAHQQKQQHERQERHERHSRKARQTGVVFRPVYASRERDSEREESSRTLQEGEEAHQEQLQHVRRTRQTGVIFRPLFATRERDAERAESRRRIAEGKKAREQKLAAQKEKRRQAVAAAAKHPQQVQPYWYG